MPDLTRYDFDCLTGRTNPEGDWVSYDAVAPIIEEVKRLRAENAALRTRVLDWVTVTDDPATLPIIDRRCLVQLIDDNDDDARRDEPMCVCKMWGPPSFDNEEDWPHFQQEYEPYHALPVIPGDRWAYIPEAPHA